MLRLCTAVALVLLPMSAQRAAAQMAAPTDSAWEKTLSCAHDLLASAGFRVRAGKLGLSASRPGELINADPPVESVDYVSVYRSDDPPSWFGQQVSLEFKRPAGVTGHWRIRGISSAFNYFKSGTATQGGAFNGVLAPSADVRSIANELRRQCSQA